MKFIKYFLILIVLISSTCNKIDRTVSLEILNPNLTMSIDSIANLNVERIPEDVELYEKQYGDTLITFELDVSGTKMCRQTWEIKFRERLNNQTFESFFHTHGSVVFDNANINTEGKFVAYNFSNNMIFLCRFIRFKDCDMLRITYYFPWKRPLKIKPIGEVSE